jgi:hypothetical protein
MIKGKSENMKGRGGAVFLHAILAILEIIAFVHDIRAFGIGMFQYYTIDSNILQMVVSICMLVYLLRRIPVPYWLVVLHLVCAVCLTVTFLIAALVLAPQGGFDYYFFSDVAPINHFLGPLLSVVTFIFTQNERPLSKRMFFAPVAATLLYGLIALILNILRVLDGPYFFLRVYEEPAATVVMWFLIIAGLCMVINVLYILLRRVVRLRHFRSH